MFVKKREFIIILLRKLQRKQFPANMNHDFETTRSNGTGVFL
jgi:hypothetical protein